MAGRAPAHWKRASSNPNETLSRRDATRRPTGTGPAYCTVSVTLMLLRVALEYGHTTWAFCTRSFSLA